MLVDIINPEITPEFSSSLNRALEQEQVANVDETRKMIDWQPQTQLLDGLRKTVKWYSQNIVN
jgi:nucleoside-diphosphate-sugar epimerase